MVEGLGGEGLRVKEYEFVVHFSGGLVTLSRCRVNSWEVCGVIRHRYHRYLNILLTLRCKVLDVLCYSRRGHPPGDKHASKAVPSFNGGINS